MAKKTSTPKTGTSLLIPNEKITITLSKTETAKSYQQTLERLAKNVTLPGFRQGKVPAKVAEDHVGKAHVIERVLDQLLPGAYQKAITAAKKTPITHPEFRLVSAELGQDWTVEAEYALLPTINLKDYKKHVAAGKKAAAKAAADIKKEAKKADSKDKNAAPAPTPEQEKEQQLQYIFRELALGMKPQVPELLLKHETQHEFEHLVGQLKQLNLTVDQYLEKRNSNMDQLSQELAVQTLNRLQLDLILGAIARQEKLSVTDADRNKHFAQIPDEKQREQFRNDAHYLGHLDTALIKQKVVDSLLTL